MSTDYTACPGKDCPIKESCHRFTGPKEPLWQSYFVEIPGKFVEKYPGRTKDKFEIVHVWKCDMFWGDVIQDSIMNQLNKIMK